MHKKVRNLTEGNIQSLLTELTIPMIFGILGIIAFNLADTYFIGKIGTVQMAALTFTFPVVTVINSINLGMGVGTSAVVSKAVGQKNNDLVRRLSTDSLTLGVLFAITAMIIGELTIVPLFTAICADSTVMPYIIRYMRIWYAGAPFVVIPMIGNNAIRALGDTKTPSMVMMFSAGVNIILDPMLIFGYGIFPEMGVSGAALATVISRGITFCVALYVLAIREKVVSMQGATLDKILSAWKTILFIGVPNAVARMIIPIGTGIITGLISGFGHDAVAGFGVATRLEFLALAVVGSLASVIPIFVGQNFGAGAFDRIHEAIRLSQRFVVFYGIGVYVVLSLIARPVAMLFSSEPAVVDVIVLYMRVASAGYAFLGILQIMTASFNALHKPVKGALLNLLQMIGIYVPMALMASKWFGLIGIFGAFAVSYAIIAAPSVLIFNKVIRRVEEETLLNL
ncbi:MAG: MATE family efflux transporter [Clostridia bacterium]|nr:MATE family efflux transporter [Clostridia bacterium]